MALVLGLTYHDHYNHLRVHSQQQGVKLARVLATIENGATLTEQSPIKQLLGYQTSDAQFAYGLVLDSQGQILLSVPNAPSSVASAAELKKLTSWMQQRQVLDGSGRQINEIIGPLRRNGEQPRYYQIGFFQPYWLEATSDLPFLASITLPVCLLAALCWFLLRREVVPIAKASAQMDHYINDKELGELDVVAKGDTAAFVKKFNEFIGYAQQRIDSSNAVSSKLITNERFLNYRMARLTNVLDTLPDGLLWLDESGKLLIANQRALDIFELTKEQMEATALHQWSDQPDICAFLRNLQQVGPKLIDPVLIDLDEANAACLQLSAFPVRQPTSTQNAIGTLVLLRDATSEALAKRGRSEFIASVAHELKTPLNTLALYTDSLIDEGDDPDIRREATTIIQDEVDRLARLINNLLNITQIEMGNLQLQTQRTRLDSLVRDTFETIARSEAAQGLDMQVQLPDELPAVTIDKDLLRIAINNLLTNAVKYSDSGDQVILAVTDNAQNISITVTDSGIGIDPSEQDKIFKKFYRAGDANASKRGGHGLGLALSKEIVQLHHGTLRLESNPGEGSTFTIELWKSTGIVREAI